MGTQIRLLARQKTPKCQTKRKIYTTNYYANPQNILEHNLTVNLKKRRKILKSDIFIYPSYL